jgi:hypothetical protein
MNAKIIEATVSRISMIIIMVFIFGFAAYFFNCVIRPVWDYDHLEKKACRAITGSELQAWATNFLAHYTNEMSLSVSEWETNFPPQLRRLAPQLGPHVSVHGFGTNEVPFVKFWWGSGFLGASGFCVGATNFNYDGGPESLTNGTSISIPGGYLRLWQPGVWFYKDG